MTIGTVYASPCQKYTDNFIIRDQSYILYCWQIIITVYYTRMYSMCLHHMHIQTLINNSTQIYDSDVSYVLELKPGSNKEKKKVN